MVLAWRTVGHLSECTYSKMVSQERKIHRLMDLGVANDLNLHCGVPPMTVTVGNLQLKDGSVGN